MKKVKFSRTVTISLVLLLACSLSGGLPQASATDWVYLSSVYPQDAPSGLASIDYPEPYPYGPGTASIQNIYAAIGTPDNNFAIINTEVWRVDDELPRITPGYQWDDADEAFIIGTMANWVYGELQLLCYTDPGHTSKIRVCVTYSETAGYGEWPYYDEVVVTWNTPQWVSFGYRGFSWKYIAVTAHSDSTSWQNNNIHIDSIRAQALPPPTPPPIPPQGIPVMFSMRDVYGSEVAGNIYLNGILIGVTDVWLYLPSYYQTGVSYELYVVPFDSNHVFQYYTTDHGDYTTNNPTPIYVIYPAIVTAVFT